jgi:glycosyltransferase involved in cell wall biosynthesis
VLGLYVGNLERYQGIDLLLESVALLEVGSPFRLLVIGGAPADVKRYRSAARKRGIDDRVRFLGPRPLDELPSHLAQADILISPRIQGENTPMKVYSYMQSGKAIVATAIRSHTQVLTDATAELVAPKAEAMAAGIARLVSDPERRTGLGRAAQAVAERDHSHAAYQSRLAQAYRMLES